MAAMVMDEEWEVLARFLPTDWRELARETGAMQRARGAITSPESVSACRAAAATNPIQNSHANESLRQ